MARSNRGIFWLSLENQTLPVSPIFDRIAQHFHVTLQHNVEMTEEIAEWIDEIVQVEVVSICNNERIQALRVNLPEEIRALCHRQHPHMTISMMQGVAPVESNRMLDADHDTNAVSQTLNFRFEFFPLR